MKRLALALLAFLAACGHLPMDQTEPGRDPVQPIRWRVDASCLAAAPQQDGATRNTLAPACDRPDRRDLVTVSISGGGVKATVFSGEALFYLQFLGLLDRTSVISGVSGGSFTAAVYALSCDAEATPCAALSPQGRKRPIWSHDAVMNTFRQGNTNVINDQVARVLTPFMSSSVSAGRFAYLIDRDYFGGGQPGPAPFTFADLNPARPHLVLNSTITSDNRGGLGTTPFNPDCASAVGRGYLRRRTTDEYFHFAFTDYYFGLIHARLGSYPLASGVAASSAFPALIDNAMLTDRCGRPGVDDKIRLMDGGANDNQALIEPYLTVAELVYGQHRSDLLTRPGSGVDRLGPQDRAFMLVVNASVTETTGTSASGEDHPSYGLVGLLSGALDKSLAGIDVYSAEGYALRRQSYVFQGWILRPITGVAPVYPSEMSITALDQYAIGGTEAALMQKSGILGQEPTDIAGVLATRRQARQSRAYDSLVDNQPARRALGLPDWHPQCYYDMRKALDASLIKLEDDDQACLREAARWSVALRAQEMCGADPADPIIARPDGLRCRNGVVQGIEAELARSLGVPGQLPGQCGRRIEAMLSEKQRAPSSPTAGAPDAKITCRPL